MNTPHNELRAKGVARMQSWLEVEIPKLLSDSTVHPRGEDFDTSANTWVVHREDGGAALHVGATEQLLCDLGMLEERLAGLLTQGYLAELASQTTWVMLSPVGIVPKSPETWPGQ